MRRSISRYRRRRNAVIGAAVALAAGFAVIRFVHSESVIHLLLDAVVGITALLFGWFAGAVVLIVPVSRLYAHPDSPTVIESIFEALIVFSVTGLAGSIAHRLQLSESKLRALLAAITDVILVLDSDGRCIDIAPTDPSLHYHGPEHLIGRTLNDIFDAQKADFFLAHVRRALELRATVLVDYMLEIEGRQRWFSASLSPIGGDAVICVARDITDRKRSEEILQETNALLEQRVDERTKELRESEAHHSRIVDQASEIIFTLNDAGVITTLNPAFERITGLPRADWIGRPLVELVVPEEQEEIAAAIAASSGRRGGVGVRRATLTKAGGSRVVVEGSFVWHVIDGERAGLLGFARDVTEQVAAMAKLQHSEQMLRESQERFRLLARATNDGTYDWDMERDVLWWGDAHYALFGYTAEDAPRVETWKQRVHPDDRERVWNSFEIAAETGQEIWSEEYRYRRADGTYAIVLDRATIMRDAKMKAVRVLGALTDMTERRHLQEQLAQAKRVSSLGRVAASIAHEFNNVLMGIQPNLEVIRRRGPEDLRAPIEHILQSVRRGKRVTDEILRFTRPGVPGLQCIDVREFFEKWSAEVRPTLGSGIDLRFDIEETLHMNVDPLQMAQVFTNLAMNARDAMAEKGGTLTITASLATSFGSFSFGVVKSADRYVHFRVNDNGCGMSKEQLAHVFEPLFTTKKNGTGLGLAVSYQLVLQHEGYMFVESERGAGTTFHVFVLAASPALHLVEPAEEQAVRTRRVLIVEDEIAVAMGIKALLELEDVAVEIVQTGGEAMPAIERFRPDCVILDIGLPDVNGADLYRDLARRWPSLAVLFSSGHADAAKLEPLLRSPSTALLLKPYEFETLKGALTRLATSAKPEQHVVAELPY